MSREFSPQWKNMLQEMCQKQYLPLPVYKSERIGGADNSPTFKATVTLYTGERFAGSTANRKKDAMQSAAYHALVAINRNPALMKAHTPSRGSPEDGFPCVSEPGEVDLADLLEEFDEADRSQRASPVASRPWAESPSSVSSASAASARAAPAASVGASPLQGLNFINLRQPPASYKSLLIEAVDGHNPIFSLERVGSAPEHSQLWCCTVVLPEDSDQVAEESDRIVRGPPLGTKKNAEDAAARVMLNRIKQYEKTKTQRREIHWESNGRTVYVVVDAENQPLVARDIYERLRIHGDGGGVFLTAVMTEGHQSTQHLPDLRQGPPRVTVDMIEVASLRRDAADIQVTLMAASLSGQFESQRLNEGTVTVVVITQDHFGDTLSELGHCDFCFAAADGFFRWIQHY